MLSIIKQQLQTQHKISSNHSKIIISNEENKTTTIFMKNNIITWIKETIKNEKTHQHKYFYKNNELIAYIIISKNNTHYYYKEKYTNNTKIRKALNKITVTEKLKFNSYKESVFKDKTLYEQRHYFQNYILHGFLFLYHQDAAFAWHNVTLK